MNSSGGVTRPDFKKIQADYHDKLSKYDRESWLATVWLGHVRENIIYNLDEYTDVEWREAARGAPCFQIERNGGTYAPYVYKHELWLNASREALRQIQLLRESVEQKSDDEFGGMYHLIAQHAQFYALFVAYVSDPALKVERDYLSSFN